MLRIALTFVVGLLTTGLFAQSGIIRGKVTSGETGEELIGAAVYIAGTTKGSSTDLEGNYSILSVEPGTYDIVCQYISFANDTIKGVEVGEDVTITNFALGSSNINLVEFVVEAKANRASENFMLTMQKKAAGVMDGISSQQIARSGDGNAAAAARRVTGVSIEGGKYVYVRGLSDRYSLTTLNEAEIPSLDPERNSVQMDLIPTNLIDNMQIFKTFTPDKPGSYTGGLVNIGTKDFPERYMFQLSTSFGYNTIGSLNEEFLTSEKSKTYFVGSGAGYHDNPITGRIETLGGDKEKLSNQGKSLSKEYSPSTNRSGLDHGFSVSAGNQKSLSDERSIGYVGGFTYNRSYRFKEDLVLANYKLLGSEEDVSALNQERYYDGQEGQETVLLGGLGNISYKMNPNNKIGFNFMVNKDATNTARFFAGENTGSDVGITQVERKLQYQERTLYLGQFKGEHYFDASEWKLNWLLSTALSKQNEPDLRYFISDYEIQDNGDTLHDIQQSKYNMPTHFWREMEETSVHAKVDGEKPFQLVEGLDGKVKFGAAMVAKDRNFRTRSFQYSMTSNMRSKFNDEYNGDPESFFGDENMNVGDPDGYLYLKDFTQIRNSYTGKSRIAAVYGMYDGYVTPIVRVVAGLRVEKTNIVVNSLDVKLNSGHLDDLDLLPALNLALNYSENVNFRVGYTRTLARPSFREIAPFASFGGGSAFTTRGNPDLVRTNVDNVDLRFEYFMKPGELLSVSVFGKNFKNPIERIFSKEAVGSELSWSNVDNAKLYGVEFEARKGLDFIDERWSEFSIGGNLTLIKSIVDLSEDEYQFVKDKRPSAGDTRQLFGQAPYIVNAFLNYNNAEKGLKANLSFNVSGEKLVVVGRKGDPHIYDQPRPTLDFNIGKVFNEKFSMKFAAKNLMNAKVNWEMHFKDIDYQTNAYSLGRTYSIGFSYFIN